MIKILSILPMMLMLLTSCSSISAVVPAGSGKYMLSGTNLAIGASGSQIKTDLYKKASDYCKEQGRIFEPVNSSSVDYRAFRGTANAELVFSCISK
jgi:putative hemolysin